MLTDIYSVLWVDLRVLRRRWVRTLSTSLINPLLYLVAFGFGLGQGINFDGYSYLEFVIPGIIALTSMSVSFGGAGQKLNVDRLFFRSFDECLMSPVSVYSIIIGKALIGVVRGLFTSTAFLLVGFLLSPTLHIDLAFMTVLVLSCFVFSFFGVLVSFLAKSHQDMSTVSSLVLLPMTFLSGTFFSLTQIPEALKIVLYFLPLTHASESLRAITLQQAFPWLSIVALLCYAGFFFAMSMVALKRSSV
ncbi:MAG: ABC transporter permease [Candidatus Bathyarchaeota archaeon]|nr:MAG: ABC transporter permease [Candidatus Bathyarchaeota archaeon]